MREWRTIKRDIENAISGYNHSVYYYRPTSDGRCGYFSIAINEEYYWEDIEEELSSVADEWNLDFDWNDTDDDLALNAYWDEHHG